MLPVHTVSPVPRRHAMTQDASLYQRRRPPTTHELASIPWLARLQPWAEQWRGRMCSRLLRGYLAVASGSDFLPADASGRWLALSTFLLDQTLYELGSALGRLLVTVEKYPDLKANQNFLQLQAQLEGTENRINVERRNFNGLVNEFNSTLRSFPTNILGRMFGFEKKPYFEAQAGAENAPKVEF